MYAKIENGKVIRCPYNIGRLYNDNPNTSFPKVLSVELLEQYGVVTVEEVATPKHNNNTHRVSSSARKVNNAWVQIHTIEELPVDIATHNIKARRNQLLAATDWRFRSDMSPSQAWVNYSQALRDITEQEGYPYAVEWPTEPAQ